MQRIMRGYLAYLTVGLTLVTSTDTGCQKPETQPVVPESPHVPRIEITQGTLKLNGITISLPCKIVLLTQTLGHWSRRTDPQGILTWEKPGLYVHLVHPQQDLVKSMVVPLAPDSHAFSPRQPFSGSLWLDGARLTTGMTLSTLLTNLASARPRPLPEHWRSVARLHHDNLYGYEWGEEPGGLLSLELTNDEITLLELDAALTSPQK